MQNLELRDYLSLYRCFANNFTEISQGCIGCFACVCCTNHLKTNQSWNTVKENIYYVLHNHYKSIVWITVQCCYSYCQFIWVFIEINAFENMNKTDWSNQSLTSTSFIIGTGLKKCRPPNLSCLFVASAMAFIDRDDVLLANIVCLQKKHKFTIFTELL